MGFLYLPMDQQMCIRDRVRAQNDLGVMAYQVIDGLHSLVDTLGIGDIAVFIQRNLSLIHI